MEGRIAIEGRWRDILGPGYAAATMTLCLGVALYAFNGFLVSTALPSAIDELGGAALISWSTSLYLLFAIIGGAIAALVKARHGPRAGLQAAALVVMLGTLLAGFAPTMPVLLAGRILQGFGEGLIAAICYALIPDIFPSPLVPKVFGAEAIVWAAAAFGGPLIAGIISEALSWRDAFLINVPLTVLFMVLVFKVVPPARERQAGGSFPLVQLCAIGAATLLVMIADLSGGVFAAGGLLCLAALFYLGAIRTDMRSPARLFPAGAFRLRGPSGLGLWVVLLMPIAQSAASVYVVYLSQHLWGYGPTLAGGLNALMAISWSISAILVAGKASPALRRQLIWLGPLLETAGLGSIFLALKFDMVGLLVTGEILTGIGFGVTWGYLSQGLMEAVPSEDRNRTATLLPTLLSAAYAIGAALVGLVANMAGAAAPEDLRQAMQVVFIFATALAVPGFVAALRLSPSLFRVRSE